MPKALVLLFVILCLVPACTQFSVTACDRIAGHNQSARHYGIEEINYGADPLQNLDYWKPAKPGVPLVIFVHGGAWWMGHKRKWMGEKGTHCLQQGYAFASLNHRLVPAHTVEEQAQDVADAVAYLIKNAAKLGFDSRRVVLTGHSSGAHLGALIGTDMRYLNKNGLGPTSLRGLILIDGGAYDVPSQIAEGGTVMRGSYRRAFGDDPVRQTALSPICHLAAPNVRDFLILHTQRPDAVTQANEFAAALRNAGIPAQVRGFDGRGLVGHMRINGRLGDPSYPATPVVDDWLKNIFAR
jgi:arylformamidase